MFDKITGSNFTHYGSIIKDITQIPINFNKTTSLTIDNQTIKNLYYSSDEIIIYVCNGSGKLIVQKDLDDEIKEFSLEYAYKLKAGIYFNVISVTKTCNITILYKVETNLQLITIDHEIKPSRIKSSFEIDEIYSYYYDVIGADNQLKNKRHSSFELIYVDSGQLTNYIDDENYLLNEYEIMIIGPNQIHHQMVKEKPTSYLSIIFKMEIIDFHSLLNKKFKIDRSGLDIINKFVSISEKKEIYTEDLMISYLKILIISLLQQGSKNKLIKPISPINQKFENEMLNEILNYINKNIYATLYLEDICEHFSISRSSLQNLFKDNLNIAPKQYINKVKLQKSQALIKESKYTISTIASMLGFNSVHYFSRKFSQYYKIPPSDFAKSIYKGSLEEYKKNID